MITLTLMRWQPTSWLNDRPQWRHTHPCPHGQTTGWGGDIHADPNAPGHAWYECPHRLHWRTHLPQKGHP